MITLFSGCLEEKNAIQSNESQNHGSLNLTPENQSLVTLSSEEENIQNIPEIEVRSFSSIYMHDNSKNLLNYLFCWDDVQGQDRDQFIEYLRTDLDIDWVKDAQIIKTDDNNTIRVSTSNSSLELKLADDKKSVLITPMDIKLVVKEENNKLCIYKVKEYDGRDDPSGSIIGQNITEKYYAVYNISIKNNGSNDLDFRTNELQMRDGDRIFRTANPDPYGFYVRSYLEVLSNLRKENKLENLTLHPGQTIQRSAAFQVNSLYNESFSMMYKERPVSSASFGKSLKALRVVERFDYSSAFGRSPYVDETMESTPGSPPIFCFWINRSVFEFINKADKESTMNSSPSSINGIHWTRIVYALKVIPERNITMYTARNRHQRVNGPLFVEEDKNHILLNDGTGEKLINTSDFDGVAILRNGSYKLYTRESTAIPQINFSNATFVQTSFEYTHGTPMDVCASMGNQDILLDEKLNPNIFVNRSRGYHFV